VSAPTPPAMLVMTIVRRSRLVRRTSMLAPEVLAG
jgi:hypothetical protein